MSDPLVLEVITLFKKAQYLPSYRRQIWLFAYVYKLKKLFFTKTEFDSSADFSSPSSPDQFRITFSLLQVGKVRSCHGQWRNRSES
jgi:hypothetical protein